MCYIHEMEISEGKSKNGFFVLLAKIPFFQYYMKHHAFK